MTIDWNAMALRQEPLRHIGGVEAGEPGCICTVHQPSGFVHDYDCGSEVELPDWLYGQPLWRFLQEFPMSWELRRYAKGMFKSAQEAEVKKLYGLAEERLQWAAAAEADAARKEWR
jgi:hypothetical protein